MPGPTRKALRSCPSSCAGPNTDARNEIWNRSNADDISFGELQKFWSQLSSAARRELLQIDKHTLFEKVRKNLYCSRCHGLLVERFSQIVIYGKFLQAGSQVRGCDVSQLGYKKLPTGNEIGASSVTIDDTNDPCVHPWGGLAVTRDSLLTVMDCFLDGMPLEALQKVFENARGRERERELLYPEACGGCGRGWISLSGGNGKAHGMKETCALHNARFSCETLVDFWSALGEETRYHLLRMKEEDFIEELRIRFDSKRFCRECRRNVLREFREMKELKRNHKEPKCTRWFCAPDTVFRYEVSDSSVQVDWKDCFPGEVNLYRHFEWAMGSAEGMSDIFGFEDSGLSESAVKGGLDLGNIADCFVTVRAWRLDGRCNELCAKAHALKGRLCVHRRLFVGDGYVSISKGESIQQFFEQAEETEEEEDDDSVNKDGSETGGEGSRPQKHAKSPELARDFLLDAATVIFKEQVEMAFREGAARQNAHSIFICLALSLLEERVRIACKEITTLEKQNKLLEEEEAEKCKEEERRERKKLKEREKKLRRKEKLKRKDCYKDGEKSTGNFMSDDLSGGEEDKSFSNNLKTNHGNDDILSVRSSSMDMTEVQPSADGFESDDGAREAICRTSFEMDNEVTLSVRDGNGAFTMEQSKSTKRRLQKQLQNSDAASRYSRRVAVPFETSHRVHLRVAPAPEQKVHKSHVQMRSEGSKHNGTGTSKQSQGWNQSANYLKNRMNLQHCTCRSPQSCFQLKGGRQSSGIMETKVPGKKSSVDDGAKTLLTFPNSHLEISKDEKRAGLDTAEIVQKDCQSVPNGGSSSRPRVSTVCADGCTGKKSHCSIHAVVTGTEAFTDCSTSVKWMSAQNAVDQKISRHRANIVGSLEDSLNSNTETGYIPKTQFSTSSKAADFRKQPLANKSLQFDVLCDAGFPPTEVSNVALGSSRLSQNGCTVTRECPSDNLEVDMHTDHIMQSISQLQGTFVQKSTTMSLSAAVEIPETVLHPSSGQDINNHAHVPVSIQAGTVLSSKSSCSLVELLAPQGEMHRLLPMSSVVSSLTPSVPPQEGCAYYLLQGPWTPHRRNGGLPVLQGNRHFIPGPTGIEFQMYPVPPLVYPAAVSSQNFIHPFNSGSTSVSCGLNTLPLKDPPVHPKPGRQCNPIETVPAYYRSIHQPLNGRSLACEQFSSVPSESQELPASRTADSLESVLSLDGSGFSLFHFGGPACTTKWEPKTLVTTVVDEPADRNIVDLSNCKFSVEHPIDNTKTKGAGEYSLFAAAPQKGFGFF
ncbi:hypothetical protein O6H91_09G027200 [Diphasiastrum complanatum]|uniref:Uncharacterized protein n=2 Tax=Diphasiastrum complanatum TaxID=34168 RepID=A0ACC2CMC4_DIPCM|nr:hypothetical protein O6H91_09G027200 [Diphasiastrum complanatum]KAJ7543154.1 hypothetical protein O6H91_09G027200 [Diphasiastrum complanatum]